MLINNRLSNDDIENLKTKEFTRKNFSRCTYPIIADAYDSYMGNSDIHRYYKNPVVVNDEIYYLTSQWLEESREDLIKYYNNHK